MPKREVQQSIIIGRGVKTIKVDGKERKVCTQRVLLEVGQVYDFTDEELAQIEAVSPNALSRTTTVDLDSGDVQLSKTEQTLTSNEKAPPDSKGGADDL